MTRVMLRPAIQAILLSSALAALQTQAAEPASGREGGIEEVIVTAERREASVQDTPLAITAITGESLEKTGISSVEAVVKNVPGVQFQGTAGGFNGVAPQIAIRGLGTDGTNKPGATSVYLDGILNHGQGAQFHDLQRVEVLRGPQGTLYGGIATAGAMNIITNDPTLDGISGSGMIDLGNYDAKHFSGVLNVPLSDSQGLRGAFNQVKRNNYLRSSQPATDQLDVRLKYLIQPSDAFSVILGGELFQLSGVTADGFYLQDEAGNIGQASPTFGFQDLDIKRASGTLNWDFGGAVLTSISAFQRMSSDTTTGNAGVNGTGVSAGHTIIPKRDLITQELRLASTGDEGLRWVGGLWYKGLKQESVVGVASFANLPIENQVWLPAENRFVNNNFLRVPEWIDNKQYGAFGQLTIPLGERLRFTAGLRYSRDDIDWTQDFNWLQPTFIPTSCAAAGFPATDSCHIVTDYEFRFTSTDWLGRFEFDVNDDSMLYAMASTGYRPGGLAVNGTTYDKEEVTAYEIGSKNRFAGDTLQVNGAVYFNDYPAFQNSATLYGIGNIQYQTIAVVPAQFYGVELEVLAVPTLADTITFSTAYSNATYSGNTTIDGSLVGAGQLNFLADGGRVPHAPEWQVNLGYDHVFTLSSGASLTGSVSGKYQTEQAVTFSPCLYDANSCRSGATLGRLVMDDYATFDASLSWSPQSGSFTATVYGRNLTDEEIKTGASNAQATLGEPRIYGVTLSARF